MGKVISMEQFRLKRAMAERSRLLAQQDASVLAFNPRVTKDTELTLVPSSTSKKSHNTATRYHGLDFFKVVMVSITIAISIAIYRFVFE